MKSKLILILCASFLMLNHMTAQSVDCGQRIDRRAFELDMAQARGVSFDKSTKKYATKVSFEGNINYSDELGYSQTRDTLYYMGREMACYVDVGRERFFSFPCTYNLDNLSESIVQRSLLAVIPAPPDSEECPDSIYRGAHLWYDGNGNAQYQYFGNEVIYTNPVDSILDIVESKIKVKPCFVFKKNTIIKTKKKNKNIVIRRGYCTESTINKNDKIEVLRGEVESIKGARIVDDLITFRADKNFKIVFKPGTVKLKKLNNGGKMEFISNAKWTTE